MKRPEQTLQMQVARYLSLALRRPTVWTAIGHGGGGRVRGAILKGMGVQPGWPDILILHLRKDSRVLVIGFELKSKTGSQSKEQKLIEAAFWEVGGVYEVVRSVDEVEDVLRYYNVPVHASLWGAGVKRRAA